LAAENRGICRFGDTDRQKDSLTVDGLNWTARGILSALVSP